MIARKWIYVLAGGVAGLLALVTARTALSPWRTIANEPGLVALVSEGCQNSLALAQEVRENPSLHAKLLVAPVEPNLSLCKLTLEQLAERGSWRSRLLPAKLSCSWMAEDAAKFQREFGIGFPTLMRRGQVLPLEKNRENLEAVLGGS